MKKSSLSKLAQKSLKQLSTAQIQLVVGGCCITGGGGAGAPCPPCC